MKKLFSIVSLLLLLIACGGDGDRRVRSTSKTLEADPIPDPIPHERLSVPDSLAADSLEGGVVMYFLKKGEGERPQATSRVALFYHGMLADGKVFDSAYDRGEPTDLSLRSMIPGLKAALLRVPVGSTVKVRVPAEQAYGASPPPDGLIPPNADLEFDVELIKIY
jgi:FKBP-type peptidyl-prolyl cis-trans isomerase